MRKETYEEFGGKLSWMGARFYVENVCNKNVLDAGYKIMVPMAKINNELYANTARLGGQITARICAPDFKLAV